MAAEGHVVRSGRQRSVGRELRRVEEDGNAAGVRFGADLLHRWQPSGDVGRAGDGQERRAPTAVEDRHDVVDVERPGGVALDPAPAGDPRPGQEVGVMLHHRGGHHVVGAEPEPVGEVVYRLGGVADQNDHVAVGRAPAAESVGDVPGVLVGRGGLPGLVARRPGARSSTREGTTRPARPRPAAPVCWPRHRGRGRGAPPRRGRAPPCRTRPGRRREGARSRRKDTEQRPGGGTLHPWKSVTSPIWPSRPGCSTTLTGPSNGSVKGPTGRARLVAHPSWPPIWPPTRRAGSASSTCRSTGWTRPSPTTGPGRHLRQPGRRQPGGLQPYRLSPFAALRRAATSFQLTMFQRALKKSAFTFLYCR